MEKRKIITGALALFVAAGAALAFKANKAYTGDLYYHNDDNVCVCAPCETINRTNIPCNEPVVYIDNNCATQYSETGWISLSEK